MNQEKRLTKEQVKEILESPEMKALNKKFWGSFSEIKVLGAD